MTISIINHSNPDLLLDCLRSIYDSTHSVSFDIWIVDNATDGTGVNEMQAEFIHVHWLFNQERLGFSANHNQVLHCAMGRYVCILNDDTVIHNGAFDELVQFMDAHSYVGMVGAKLLNADGSIQNCTFRFMTLLSELIGICLLPRSLSHLKMIGIDSAQFQDEPALVDWVLGACIVARDITLHQIGLLDSELSPIANTEEVDWCFRANRAGWKVAYCPTAGITHFGGQSLKSTKSGLDMIRVEMYRTRIAFFHKHYGWLQAFLLRLIYILTLPWNIMMLMQSLAFRKIEWKQCKSHLITLGSIAAMGLLLKRPGWNSTA